MENNRLKPEIEQLDEEEYNLDVEEQQRLQQEAEKRIQQVIIFILSLTMKWLNIILMMQQVIWSRFFFFRLKMILSLRILRKDIWSIYCKRNVGTIWL